MGTQMPARRQFVVLEPAAKLCGPEKPREFFEAAILQQCFVLYNEAVEDALSASHAIRRFLGMNLAG
ncbi:MAG: hypothetical protein EBX71_09300, partial [Betaproteobacteria bacterium]|nr:hypothetical protein [Betaproteobacteria bacterium]